ncbi:MAG: hypothetical protein GF388_09850 [Candidatus Aegiribacteria sp.]|nr:hypothetical protein [Candidatus Aegiribacteria sp.]MBD3295338.1 hypothetical protein [Candidatus Fermentibacteria bacterium]
MFSRTGLNYHWLWIFPGAPLFAWILPGQTSVSVYPLVISSFTYCGPAIFLLGWTGSRERRSLLQILYGTRAGKYSLVFPEILLPFLAGAVPAVLTVLLGPAGRASTPWQLWVVIPFASLTAVSLIILMDKYLGTTGNIVNLLAFMSQASSASWTLSPVFQLLLPHGYVLWTLRWIEGSGAAFHGDIYAFVSVLEGIGLLFPTVALLIRPPSRS